MSFLRKSSPSGRCCQSCFICLIQWRWIGPIIIVRKILMQSLWRDAVGWDDALPPEIHQAWFVYFQSFDQLKKCSIPRWTGLSNLTSLVQLHGFSDASEKACGVACYIRVVSASVVVTSALLTSKTMQGRASSTIIVHCKARVRSRFDVSSCYRSNSKSEIVKLAYITSAGPILASSWPGSHSIHLGGKHL